MDISSWAGAAAVYNTTSPAYAPPADLTCSVKPTDGSTGPSPYKQHRQGRDAGTLQAKVISVPSATAGQPTSALTLERQPDRGPGVEPHGRGPDRDVRIVSGIP